MKRAVLVLGVFLASASACTPSSPPTPPPAVLVVPAAPSTPAASSTPAPAPAPAPAAPWKGRVLVHPDPEESIELLGDDGKRGFVAEPYDLHLWQYFNGGRIELWPKACPASVPPMRSGAPHVCVDHWRHEGKAGDHVEVGPERTLRGRFVAVAAPKGSKREGETEVRFRTEGSELMTHNVHAGVIRDRDVTIRARVVDVQAMQTYATVMGPQLYVLDVK